MSITIVITFHYEGTKKFPGAGYLHFGTLVDHEKVLEQEENTTPGLHIYTNHDIDGYSKESLLRQVEAYANDRFVKPYKIQFKTEHQTKTRLYR